MIKNKSSFWGARGKTQLQDNQEHSPEQFGSGRLPSTPSQDMNKLGDWNKLYWGCWGVLQQLLFIGSGAMLFCPEIEQTPKPT